MDNTPESRLLFCSPLDHPHFPAKRTRQPVTHFTGHFVCLQVTEFILSVQQMPGWSTERAVRAGSRCIYTFSSFRLFFSKIANISKLIWLSKVLSVEWWKHIRIIVKNVPGLIRINGIQHGSSQLQVSAEFCQVHIIVIHLLQGPLQPDRLYSVIIRAAPYLLHWTSH